MKPAGGLKLAVEGGDPQDRRVRFAPVTVSAVPSTRELNLVTDARGRLRYRLYPGEYRLRVEHATTAHFAVRPRGWTTVRLRLP